MLRAKARSISQSKACPELVEGDPVFACSQNRPRKRFSHRLAAMGVLFIALTYSLHAQTLTGTIQNATTGKPSAGDDVVLLKLGQGMEEAGRTKSDAKGNFSFKLDDAQSPHLVRAIHQGVTYHRMAPPGTTSAEVPVYDVAKKVDGIEVVADVMRVQAEQGQLEVVRMFAVQNKSTPLRTQMNERNLEFYVPEGAQIIQGLATTEGGNALKTDPVKEGEKNRYAFAFPLRPGTTQFEIAYQVPYTGSANIDPKSIYPLEHFVAILPKTVDFTAAPGANFSSMNDPNQPDGKVEVASNTKANQTLAFKITGEGVLQERGEANGNGGGGNAAGSGGNEGGSGNTSAQNDTRPGGGLGPPIDAPDPLHKYQFYILGGFAAVLAAGAIYTASRQQSAVKFARATVGPRNGDAEFTEPAEVAPATEESAKPAPAKRSASSMLLEGLKEELFQLEVDRQQSRITQQEYEKTKSALDQTLEHALKREAQKS